jgi:heme exporter protein D
MMPDLGKYAGAVLSAYAVGLVLIACLVALSVWRARSVARALDAVRKREAGNG